MPIELQEKRDFMATFLMNSGFLTTVPQGGCFLLANWSQLGKCFNLFQLHPNQLQCYNRLYPYFFSPQTKPKPKTMAENRIDFTYENDQQKDYRFSKWMVKNLGIQGIPPTIFYSAHHKVLGENYIRFCFLKKIDVLQKAASILENWQY